jgi:hypothetical protein
LLDLNCDCMSIYYFSTFCGFFKSVS